MQSSQNISRGHSPLRSSGKSPLKSLVAEVHTSPKHLPIRKPIQYEIAEIRYEE
jgi:hypothetical protein